MKGWSVATWIGVAVVVAMLGCAVDEAMRGAYFNAVMLGLLAIGVSWYGAKTAF
jgi:hypothetical protein